MKLYIGGGAEHRCLVSRWRSG